MPKRMYFVFFIIFFLGILLGSIFSKNNNFLPKSSELSNIVKHTYEDEIITEKTKIVCFTYYKKCGHTRVFEIPVQKYVGQKFTDFEKGLESGVKIEKFSSDEIIIKKEEDSYCDDHYYIGTKDGFVSLFKGVPGEPSMILEKTDIPIDVLKEEDRNILERGIVIKDKEEFYKILEGLSN